MSQEWVPGRWLMPVALVLGLVLWRAGRARQVSEQEAQVASGGRVQRARVRAEQSSSVPQPPLTVATLSAALVTILVWVLGQYGIEVTPEVAAAATMLASFLFGKLAPEHWIKLPDEPEDDPDSWPQGGRRGVESPPPATPKTVEVARRPAQQQRQPRRQPPPGQSPLGRPVSGRPARRGTSR